MEDRTAREQHCKKSRPTLKERLHPMIEAVFSKIDFFEINSLTTLGENCNLCNKLLSADPWQGAISDFLTFSDQR
jgi:hypothetical protein